MQSQTQIQRTLDQSQAQLHQKLDQVLQYQSLTSNTHRQGGQAENLADCADVSAVGITVSRTRCTCAWQSTSIRMPMFLGTLFIGYAAARRTGWCQGWCSSHKETKYWLQYLFPTWFLRYALQFEAKVSNDNSTIRCCLTVTQIIPTDHVVYDLLELEDVDAIRNLLVSGQLCINAQDNIYNVPLLNVRQ